MFTVLTSFLLLFPTITALLILLRRIVQSLRPSETHNGVPRPPLVPDWVPFLGSALSMAGGDSFWQDTAERFGPVFRARVMGETRIFVTTTPVRGDVCTYT
jgi:cholesterol 7alpha-monooxygenase